MKRKMIVSLFAAGLCWMLACAGASALAYDPLCPPQFVSSERVPVTKVGTIGDCTPTPCPEPTPEVTPEPTPEITPKPEVPKTGDASNALPMTLNTIAFGVGALTIGRRYMRRK